MNENIVVLKHLSFNIKKGSINTILGKSGSGKTTLLNIIGGLIKPDKGQIFLHDKPYNYNFGFAKFRAFNFGYIFQNHNLLPEFTIKENLIIPSLINKTSIDSIKKIKYFLKLFKLEKLINKYPDFISKGECQRISIIRSLINSPKLVIADEPTANLDEKNVKIIFDLFIKLNRELNYTFIIATHDKKFIDFSTNIYKLENNKLETIK